jgi:hypothetical protein
MDTLIFTGRLFGKVRLDGRKAEVKIIQKRRPCQEAATGPEVLPPHLHKHLASAQKQPPFFSHRLQPPQIWGGIECHG